MARKQGEIEGACIICGCTEENACAGGCSWVCDDPPICSACAELGVKIAKSIKRRPELGILFGLKADLSRRAS